MLHTRNLSPGSPSLALLIWHSGAQAPCVLFVCLILCVFSLAFARYVRLDGQCKIEDRRDMVADFQASDEIFAFLLSTRAGGLGINLTAADTVIFYDSDWNPTVDQQAMDRSHRLGQTKQVTVYRLITKNTVEERILARAQEKSKVQDMVIAGGSYSADVIQGGKLQSKEVVSLLLDDEVERKSESTVVPLVSFPPEGHSPTLADAAYGR